MAAHPQSLRVSYFLLKKNSDIGVWNKKYFDLKTGEGRGNLPRLESDQWCFKLCMTSGLSIYELVILIVPNIHTEAEL